MEECEDAEGVVRWRSISQEGSDELWKELCGTMAEEVLEKYEVDEATKGAHQGRGESFDWRIAKKQKRCMARMMR